MFTDKSQLTAGKLYVCCHINDYDETDYGSLVWFGSDGKFYNADYPDTEGNLDRNAEYADGWLEQAGDINPDYIFLTDDAHKRLCNCV